MFRWMVFLPAAALAAVVILQLGYVLVLLYGGGSALLWIPVGAVATVVFFRAAFSLAPSVNAIVKWSCVLVAGGMWSGVLIDTLLSKAQLSAAAAYLPLAAGAIYYSLRLHHPV
jgi:hypothetical protein